MWELFSTIEIEEFPGHKFAVVEILDSELVLVEDSTDVYSPLILTLQGIPSQFKVIDQMEF